MESMGARTSAAAAEAASTPTVARGLWPGSADPHGVGDVDRVPPPARAPSVAMARHVVATDVELAAREFAVANDPPVTSPSEQPEVQEQAPEVTMLEQVIKPAYLRLYRRWIRMLRRCFRAAARGKVSLARRLRPDDLWLDHEDATVEGMRGWDWDFRPLAQGLPARPLSPSRSSFAAAGVEGGWVAVDQAAGTSPPATSLRAAAVVRGAEGFADQAIVREMLDGVEDDSKCRRGTLLCGPHAGALKSFDVAVRKAAGNIENGWASGGWELPCWPLRSCPYSVVDESVRAGKPKFRLTTDLSWPHSGAMTAAGVAIDSVNGAMDRSEWPANRLVRVTEYAEASEILQGGGRRRRVRLWSFDGEAFYRAVGRQRLELWRNATFWPDGVQLDERCCFGDAAAATKCSRMSNYIVHNVRRAMARVDEMFPTRDAEWMQWQVERTRDGLACDLGWVGMYIERFCAGEVGIGASEVGGGAEGY